MYSSVGASLFVWGFDCPRTGFVVREVGLCNLEGTHHACFYYNLPEELPNQFTEHGLDTRFRSEYRDANCLESDIEKWLNLHMTPTRPQVAVHRLGYSANLTIGKPLVMVEVEDLAEKPIGTVGALPSGQQELLCTQHSQAWHDICARLMACRLSAWMGSINRHMPSLSEVNAQRILWQQRADSLTDTILCDDCQQEKNEAYAKGEGIQWVTNCDWPCKQVARILEEGVYCEKDFYLKDRVYGDESLHQMWSF